MHAVHQKKNDKLYISYTCSNNTCTTGSFSHQKIEKEFVKYLDNIDTLKYFVEIKKILLKLNNEVKKQINELKTLESQKERIYNLFLNNKIKLKEYKVLIKKLDSKIIVLKNEINKSNYKDNEEKIKTIILDISLNWKYLLDNERKIFLEKFINCIETSKDKLGVIISKVVFYT